MFVLHLPLWHHIAANPRLLALMSAQQSSFEMEAANAASQRLSSAEKAPLHSTPHCTDKCRSLLTTEQSAVVATVLLMFTMLLQNKCWAAAQSL